MLGEIIKDPINITKGQIIQILNLIYVSEDCKATASQLTLLLGMSDHRPLNLQVANYGRRIIKELNIERPKNQKGEYHGPWSVPYASITAWRTCASIEHSRVKSDNHCTLARETCPGSPLHFNTSNQFGLSRCRMNNHRQTPPRM